MIINNRQIINIKPLTNGISYGFQHKNLRATFFKKMFADSYEYLVWSSNAKQIIRIEFVRDKYFVHPCFIYDYTIKHHKKLLCHSTLKQALESAIEIIESS